MLGIGSGRTKAAGRLAIEVAAKMDQYDRDMKDVRQTAKKTGKDASGEMDKSAKSISKSFKGAALAIKAAFAAVIASAALRIGKQLFDIGTAAVATASKFGTVFGPELQRVNEYLEENASRMGAARSEMQEMLASTAGMVQGIGATIEESADLSIQIAELSGDLASFNNVQGGAADVAQRISKALLGERESLKQLSVAVSEEEVKQRALLLTGKERIEQVTAVEKAQATLAVITEKAGVALGDLDRTQDSAANTARRLAAEYRTLRETIAVAVLPIFDELLGVVDSVDFVRFADALQTDVGEAFRNLGIIMGARLGQGLFEGLETWMRQVNVLSKIPGIGGLFDSINLAAAGAGELADLAKDSADDASESISILANASGSLGSTAAAIAAARQRLASASAAAAATTDGSLTVAERAALELRDALVAADEAMRAVDRTGADLFSEVPAILADVRARTKEMIEGLGVNFEESNAARRAEQASDAIEQLAKESDDWRDALMGAEGVLLTMGVKVDDLHPLTRALVEEWREMRGEVEEVDEGITEIIGELSYAARGAVQLANAFGAVGDNAASVVNEIALMGEGIGRVSKALSAKEFNLGDFAMGVGGVLGGIAGLVGSLFGESPEEKARREALERNTREIAGLRGDFREQRQIIARAQGETFGALKDLFAGIDPTVAEDGLGFFEFLDQKPNIDRFIFLMDRMDLSVEDVNAMLEEMGISVRLVEKDGKIAAESIFQVSAALAELQIADFFEGFEGSLEHLRRAFDIRDIDD
ncbi:MAG TPA: hypothetical protein VMN39_10725, partial [Longimicrobiaceae bacterium]|nr:hypothetical protein [Longimicrobiaceae bacterium]